MSKSKVIATLLTVLAIAILVKLGLWQLERASEKQALFDDFEESQLSDNADAFLDLATVKELPGRYAPVQITGHFTPHRYLLLDNQIRDGQVGYQVIGLLKNQRLDEYVPVNMGWVSIGSSRQDRPDVALPEGEVTVHGWFYQPDQQGFLLSDQVVESEGWPMRVQQLRFDAIRQATQLPIAPYVVLLSETADYGWPRSWEPMVMTPEKHQAYALQWFSLALACLVIVFFASRSRTKTTEE
ncbi:SURF1 family protein [Pseudidiomarina sp.]|uniref:SURF1 family protein n=1 Tax=Pseudidiomarina sp. TaxID=2081707 RepID=UPI00299E650D|nr:SURF1 family protein [Pseudidiomarina sp.]MDX1706323.1 SURF1 family protein [Pseudidiomarina sp.]